MKRYQNQHAGETCLIIGNGPSLNEIPLEFLRQYPTFGTNRIFLLDGFQPSYYVAINALVIEQSFDPIAALSCPKFVRAIYARYLDAYPLTSIPGHGFSLDPVSYIHEGWTVTYVCMQLAYYMGYSTVLLVGVDHRYTQTGKPNEKVVSPGNDPNHFAPAYFGRGFTWQCADLERSGQAYVIARDTYAKANRKIINLTPGTALDVFPKADWRQYASRL